MHQYNVTCTLFCKDIIGSIPKPMQIMTSLASALSIELQLASGRTNDVIVRFIKFYSKSMEVRILFV